MADLSELAKRLATCVDEAWMFLYLHAEEQRRDHKAPTIHEHHAAMLARIHAALTDAHGAGLLPRVPTERMALLLEQQGFDLAALSAPVAASQAEGA